MDYRQKRYRYNSFKIREEFPLFLLSFKIYNTEGRLFKRLLLN